MLDTNKFWEKMRARYSNQELEVKVYKFRQTSQEGLSEKWLEQSPINIKSPFSLDYKSIHMFASPFPSSIFMATC